MRREQQIRVPGLVMRDALAVAPTTHLGQLLLTSVARFLPQEIARTLWCAAQDQRDHQLPARVCEWAKCPLAGEGGSVCLLRVDAFSRSSGLIAPLTVLVAACPSHAVGLSFADLD
jgi:hypothetical protein